MTAPPNIDFSLTPEAVDRVAALIEADTESGSVGNGGPVFRVAVLGGGCSGFQYQFSIDDTIASDDHIIKAQASTGAHITIAVDEMSLGFLAGSRLDYKQELIGSYFAVSNPNATAACGCGTSFAI